MTTASFCLVNPTLEEVTDILVNLDLADHELFEVNRWKVLARVTGTNIRFDPSLNDSTIEGMIDRILALIERYPAYAFTFVFDDSVTMTVTKDSPDREGLLWFYRGYQQAMEDYPVFAIRTM